MQQTVKLNDCLCIAIIQNVLLWVSWMHALQCICITMLWFPAGFIIFKLEESGVHKNISINLIYPLIWPTSRDLQETCVLRPAQITIFFDSSVFLFKYMPRSCCLPCIMIKKKKKNSVWFCLMVVRWMSDHKSYTNFVMSCSSSHSFSWSSCWLNMLNKCEVLLTMFLVHTYSVNKVSTWK